MIVLDTHAWNWWLSDPRQLGRLARRRIEAAIRIGIPAICCLEVATLAHDDGSSSIGLPSTG